MPWRVRRVPMRKPIWVPCEGSGCPPVGPQHICSMCGGGFRLTKDWKLTPHDRKDILAMVARGDFDGSESGEK